MKNSFFYIVLAFLLEFSVAKCKNILAVFPHFGRSHLYMYEPYVLKLAERGHKVSVLSWLNLTAEHENLKIISFGPEKIPYNLNLSEYENLGTSFFNILHELKVLNHWAHTMCSVGLSSPKVKKLVESKPHFDVIIVEYFHSDCFAVLSHFFSAPIIGIFSSPLITWHNDRMGNPDNPSYIPNVFSNYPSNMNFYQRLKNTFWLLYTKAYYKIYYDSQADKLIKKNFGKGIPKVQDIVSNTSLFIFNSHYSVFEPKPFVPGVIEVAGLHIREDKTLPVDIEQYLNSSTNGVIYFSLGTVTTGSTLPPKKKNVFINVFRNLTQNILWKWENEFMPDKPTNVLLKKWVPQNDLLGKYL